MKKTIKVISILMIVLAIIFATTTVFASDYRPSGVQIDTSETDSVQSVGSRILGIVRVVGTIVAVGMLIVLGIKYMMGSAEERAEYKKSMFPYLIGAVLIFAASNLTQIIYDWATKI